MMPEITTPLIMVTLLLSLKILFINKDSKNPIFIGPFLESQNMQYQLYPVGHFMRRKYDVIFI